MRRLFPALLLTVLSTGCASTAVIRSEPLGALVRSRSGEPLGKTPYEHTDSAMVNHTEGFSIELEGYEPEYVTIKRDQWNGLRTAGSIIGGLLFFPALGGLFWAADYKEVYHVPLREVPEGEEEQPEAQRSARSPAPARKRVTRP
jgi:hypothetical protein